MRKIKILMVCLGNICRSPLAQGILHSKIKKNAFIDSAGTASYHIGRSPDPRNILVAKKKGLILAIIKHVNLLKRILKNLILYMSWIIQTLKMLQVWQIVKRTEIRFLLFIHSKNKLQIHIMAVSYTHLTLPTKRIV